MNILASVTRAGMLVSLVLASTSLLPLQSANAAGWRQAPPPGFMPVNRPGVPVARYQRPAMAPRAGWMPVNRQPLRQPPRQIGWRPAHPVPPVAGWRPVHRPANPVWRQYGPQRAWPRMQAAPAPRWHQPRGGWRPTAWHPAGSPLPPGAWRRPDMMQPWRPEYHVPGKPRHVPAPPVRQFMAHKMRPPVRHWSGPYQSRFAHRIDARRVDRALAWHRSARPY